MSHAFNWCGGKLAEAYGAQWLGGYMGGWHCMNCGAELPYSWWRSFVTKARLEIAAERAAMKERP